ncbi:hypothetical protein CR513_17383, partial [Mucuna pruriens]
MQVVPKKSEMTGMKNQHDELVPMRMQNNWQVCINYRRLNQATRKNHFPFPFIDQVLEKLEGKSHYCFLDGFSGYMQIYIAPEDQHKTTFTFQYLCIHTHVVWPMQCVEYVSTLHDKYLLRLATGLHGSLYGRLHEIRDKKGAENSVADHLSRIKRESDPIQIRDEFPDEQPLHINMPTPWFADICNFVAASQFPLEASQLYKEKLRSDAKYYIWDDPHLWRLYND